MGHWRPNVSPPIQVPVCRSCDGRGRLPPQWTKCPCCQGAWEPKCSDVETRTVDPAWLARTVEQVVSNPDFRRRLKGVAAPLTRDVMVLARRCGLGNLAAHEFKTVSLALRQLPVKRGYLSEFQMMTGQAPSVTLELYAAE